MSTRVLFLLFFVSLFVIPKSFGNPLTDTPTHIPTHIPSHIPSNKVELSLTPLACFVKKNGDVCHITVKVAWQSSLPINACLYQNSEKLHCWSATQKATKKIPVSLSENMQFTLQGADNIVYAQQQVAIAASTSQKYRRRLRADWSLF